MADQYEETFQPTALWHVADKTHQEKHDFDLTLPTYPFPAAK